MHKWLEKKTDELLDQAKEMSPKRIKSIRASYGLTQVAFSILLDISYDGPVKLIRYEELIY